MSKIEIDTVIFDMDGVFCDFVGYMEYLHNCSIEELNQDRSIIGRTLESTVPMGLFLKLPEVKDYNRMFMLYHWANRAAKNVFFCSLTTVHHHKARCDKRAWLQQRLGANVKAEFVNRGVDKRIFAHPRALLIDDHVKNCDPFVNAGGHAIKHESAKTTADELKNNYTIVR